MVLQSVALVKDSARLYEENGKLRDLVQYMYRCFVMGHDWGPYCNCETVHVEEQMRELGFKEV